MSIPVAQSIAKCIKNGMAEHGMTGTTDTRVSLGHLKLTHAAKRAFGITRLPTHPERFADYESSGYLDIAAALEKMTPRQWDALIADLLSIYRPLQATLLHRYPSKRVTLQRRIKVLPIEEERLRGKEIAYAEHVGAMLLKGQREEQPTIAFDCDILTGWCLNDPGNYGQILIRHEFPIEDVLLAAPYISSVSGIETDEWMVLNRSPSGLIEIDPRKAEIPDELTRRLSKKADQDWNMLKQIRLDSRMQDAKLPMRYFGSYEEWHPPIVKMAIGIARWYYKTKRHTFTEK